MKTIIQKRTKSFAAAIWHFCETLPNSQGYYPFKNQLIRSLSSVGANYRAAQRGKSTADFINKLKIVEEEADETLFFLELLLEINKSLEIKINPLHKEGSELLAITVASIKTARKNNT
tara:strand:- start:35323 stop:35676 length:354 start_codon:yes stop_codon:yes gene_type:complete